MNSFLFNDIDNMWTYSYLKFFWTYRYSKRPFLNFFFFSKRPLWCSLGSILFYIFLGTAHIHTDLQKLKIHFVYFSPTCQWNNLGEYCFKICFLDLPMSWRPCMSELGDLPDYLTPIRYSKGWCIVIFHHSSNALIIFLAFCMMKPGR